MNIKNDAILRLSLSNIKPKGKKSPTILSPAQCSAVHCETLSIIENDSDVESECGLRDGDRHNVEPP
jgi:hypothetical protein